MFWGLKILFEDKQLTFNTYPQLTCFYPQVFPQRDMIKINNLRRALIGMLFHLSTPSTTTTTI
jgi:hypothetical protein